MIKYFLMKKKEIKLKLALYTYVSALLDEKSELLKTFEKLYLSVKDTPAQELQDKFISKLAELAHEQAQNETERM